GNGAHDGRLIWIDLEMTGLNTDRDSLIEIATVVTDSELNILADGPELAISHPLPTLEAMDDWNRTQHTRSGFWRRVLEEGVRMARAGLWTLQVRQQCIRANRSPMCGTSISQDRRFLLRMTPSLERHFP